MKILRNLALSLLSLTSFPALTAEQGSGTPTQMPSFVVLGYDQKFQSQSRGIINQFIQDDIFKKLDIKVPLGERDQPATQREIKNFQLKKGWTEYYLAEQEARQLNETLSQPKPIIIICDTSSTKVLQDTLRNCPPNSIHSVILINPSVYTPLNFNAISHRVYNFYSKAPVAITDIATSIRKYTPNDNGFTVQADRAWSKIVNIRCIRESSKGHDEDIALTSDAITQLNIPALIAIADKNYRCNWDLAAVVARAPGDSNYANMHIPLLFLNRELEIRGNEVTNTAEKWHLTLSPTQLETLQEQLDNENQFHAIITAPCYNNVERKWRCPALKDCPAIKAKAPSNVEAAAFFVPRITAGANKATSVDGINLVALIRCQNRESLHNEFFKIDIGGTINNASHFIFLDKNPWIGNKSMLGSLISLIPYFSTLSADPYYYAILKLRLPRNDWQRITGQRFSILFNGESLGALTTGLIPTIDDKQDIRFIAFADIQKQDQLYSLEDPESGSALYELAQVLADNELHIYNPATYQPNSLYLVVGDLVRNGKNSNSWLEVLSKLNSIVSNRYLTRPYPFSLLSTAIGTHDFADVDWSLLSFYAMKPIHGYLFNFSPESKQAESDPTELDPQQLVNQTNSWFDRGRVRFIHLPYTTEEETTPVANIGDISGLAKRLFETVKGAARPFTFNPTQILPQFTRNLAKAAAGREAGLIDFIIVYGHAPLATAPQYEHLHKGLLNSFIDNDFKTAAKQQFARIIIQEMATNGVDLYLSGHNHQYDRCRIDYSIQQAQSQRIINGSFPAVTLGLGTVLRKPHALSEIPTLAWFSVSDPQIKMITIKSEQFISGADSEKAVGRYMSRTPQGGFILPAYLECTTQGNALRCRLLTRNNTALDEFNILSHRVITK